jgi:hypothetical protein
VIGTAGGAGIVGHGRKSKELVQLQFASVRFIALYEMRPCPNCVLRWLDVLCHVLQGNSDYYIELAGVEWDLGAWQAGAY